MTIEQSQQSNINKKILLLAEYIEQQAHDDLNLELLASRSGISVFHLQRTFKTIFGVSPKQFQNAIRIRRFKQSLQQGVAISTAIYDAGFGSTSRIYEQVNDKFGMTPAAYKAGGMGEKIAFTMRNTTFGHIILAATYRGVCLVHIADNYTDLIKALHQEFPHAELAVTVNDESIELEQWLNALEHHLIDKGPRPNVPMHLYGTAFQLKVWKFLMSIKEGETMSYSQAAKGINSPKAVRALANACGANKIALLIPCHRVLRGDGKLGGYRWGVARKRWLLEREAVSNCD